MKRGESVNSVPQTTGVRAAKAVARDHGVDPITVWRWGRDGLVDIVHIANRPYVTLDSLERFHRRVVKGELAKAPSGAAKQSADARAAREGEKQPTTSNDPT